MKKLLLLLFTIALITHSCRENRAVNITAANDDTAIYKPQSSADVILEVCDSALACIDKENLIFYQILNPATYEIKRVKLSEDSIARIADLIRNVFHQSSLTEGYKRYGNTIDYSIVNRVDNSLSVEGCINLIIDNKKITKIYYMPGFDEMELSEDTSDFFDFLSKFENDREYRMAHLAKPVKGFDYPSQYNENGELRRASSDSWQKENIEKYLDIYSDVNERARLGLGEQFWRTSPTYACLIVTDNNYMWGGVYGFKKTDGEWLLTDFSASTAEYPSMGSVMSGVPDEARLIMQKAQ